MEENPENSIEPEQNNVEFAEPLVVEKKKRQMTPAQLANLEKMRHKKAVKTEAKKLIQSELPQTFVGANGANEILQLRQKYEEDLEEVRELKNYMRDYFEYKQQKNEVKKQNNKKKVYSNDWEYEDEYTQQVQFKLKI
jgi:hypothetical protein